MIGYILAIGLPILLQVLLIIHILRNGKSMFWIYIIIFLLPVGAIVYFIMEILPDLRAGHHVARAGNKIANAVDPGWSVRKLEKALEESDTLENKKKLAEACLKAGDTPRAEALVRECRTGVFANDRDLLVLLAEIQDSQNKHDEAKETWSKNISINGEPEGGRESLLYGKFLEKTGDFAEAERHLKTASLTGATFEALYYLSKLYDKTGRTEEAGKTREAIKRKGKKLSGKRRSIEQEWIKKARDRL